MAEVRISATVFLDRMKTGEKHMYDEAKKIVEAELGGTISDEQFINMMVKQALRDTVKAGTH